MGSSKAPANWTPSLVRKFAGGGLFGSLVRRAVMVAVATVLIMAGWTYAWRTWGQPGTGGEDYVVVPDKISVTSPPAWIHTDVKSEVVKAGDLASLPLRDPQLVDKVARAFAAHPWVEKVAKVSKHYPARVQVELEYRRPVAMVEVTWKGEPKLYFIDGASVLLPSEDFEKEIAQKAPHYLRIFADDVSPTGRAFGTKWGSERIEGAALLAQAWQDRWQALGLYKLLVDTRQDPNGKPMYWLETKAQTRVHWGHAPGSETPGEQSASEKITWLEQYVAKNGPLDKSAAGSSLDLRTPSGKAPPQTARKSGGQTR